MALGLLCLAFDWLCFIFSEQWQVFLFLSCVSLPLIFGTGLGFSSTVNFNVDSCPEYSYMSQFVSESPLTD